ncbi:MAG: mechanosensitive ion channel family protein [Rhodanobacter sp.]
MQTLQDVLELPGIHTALGVLALVALAWLAGQLVRRLLARLIEGIVRRTATRWDDALLGYGTFRWLARALPAPIIQYGIALVPDVPERAEALIGNVMTALVVFCLVMAINAALSASGAMYQQTPRGQQRPIKGLLQLIKIGLFIVAALVIIASITGKQVGLLLSGVGAMSAVLMLIFKDTILGFVAGVQLSSNDMLRVGDWIEMPQLNADGDVIDIALHTVKVRNWDKTITTIPSWRLISDSYKNWRGMQEIGGRRIKRVLYIDAASVHFLDDEELRHFSQLHLLADYLPSKERDVQEWNQALGDAATLPANRRRLTNLGTFRAYVQAYLDTHPQIHRELSCMVRQLASGPQGVPLELYCFTTTVKWAEYEGIQSDIFDHLFASMSEFGLALYQQPSGRDVRAALTIPHAAAPAAAGRRVLGLGEA